MRTGTMTVFGLYLASTMLFAAPREPIRQDAVPSVDLYGSVIAQLKQELPALMNSSNVPGLSIALIDGQNLV